MQIYPTLDNCRLEAIQAYRETLIYDDPNAFLLDLQAALEHLQEHFALLPDARDYWTARRALERLTWKSAMYAQDGDHGQSETPPTPPNPSMTAFLYAAGTLATAVDANPNRYAHWEDFETDLNTWLPALAALLTPPPAERNRNTILQTLYNIAAHAALFLSRAELTINDLDPHATENYAVIAWRNGEWTTTANHCNVGYHPNPPADPGRYENDSRCIPCQPDYYGAAPPDPTPARAIPTLAATPYHARPRHTRAAGVITGAHAAHWPVIAATALSTNAHNIPFAIADHGLTDAQRAILRRFRVHWIQHPQPKISPDILPARAVSEPRAWWKPWVCAASPFDRTMWVDADAIPLFRTLTPLRPENPLPLVATNRTWTPRNAHRYTALVAAMHPQAPAPTDHDPEAEINTGILFWTRDAPLIALWQLAAQALLAQPDKARTTIVRDQAAMFLALRTIRLETGCSPYYLPDAWNTPADFLAAPDAKHRKPIPSDPRQLLDTTRQRHPTAEVVHWIGRPKPAYLYQET